MTASRHLLHSLIPPEHRAPSVRTPEPALSADRLEIVRSNRIPALIDACIDRVEQARGRGIDRLFSSIPVLIPNRVLAAAIRFRAARRTGIAMGFDFLSFRAFLTRVLESSDDPLRLLDPDRMQRVLIDRLSTPEALSAPVFEPVRRYLGTEDLSSRARDRRLFQLSERIARWFETYARTRPDWIRAWEGAPAPTDLPGGRQAAWQRRLWLDCFGPGGLVEQEARATGERWLAWPHLLERIAGGHLPIPPTVHVVRTPSLAQVHHNLLRSLATRARVHCYDFSPCLTFREDLPETHRCPKRVLRRLRPWDRKEHQLQFGFGGTEEWRQPEPNPLLGFWGEGERARTLLLEALREGRLTSCFTLPEKRPKRLLDRVRQAVLLRDRVRRSRARPDDSLRILACPGLRREVEIVVNELWELLRRNDENPRETPLRFDEIGIGICSRNLEGYQTHFRSVFGELGNVPHTLLDVPARRNRMMESVSLLLDLPLGSFERSDFLRFLVHPSVQAGLDEIQSDRWLNWVERVAIYRGADEADHEGSYIPDNRYTWDQGLKRLITGLLTGGETECLSVLPEPIGADGREGIGTLCLLVRSLVADVRAIRSEARTWADWAALLSAALRAYLTPSTEAEERIFHRCLDAVRSLEDLGGSRSVPYEIVRQLLRRRLDGVRMNDGHPIGEGVLVGPLEHLLPRDYRVLFLVGLGEGEIPGQMRDDALDLRRLGGRPGDLAPGDAFRHRFLEGLACTRESLVLSYVSRDAATGEPRQPAALVRELTRVLDTILDDGERSFIVRHPLRRYDPAYFPTLYNPETERTGLPNVSESARSEARCLAFRDRIRERGETVEQVLSRLSEEGRERVRDLLKLPDLPDREDERSGPLSLRLSQLRTFLESPLQGSASLLLGIGRDEPSDPLLETEEPLRATPLAETLLLRDVFLQAREEGNLDEWYARAVKRRKLQGQFPAGPFGKSEERRHRAILEGWNRGLTTLWPEEKPLETLRFGSSSPSEGRPPLRFIGPDERDLDLTGRTSPLHSEEGRCTVVRLNARRDPDLKDALRGFLSGVCLTLAEDRPTRLRVCTVGPEKAQTWRFGTVSPDAGRAWLETLFADLFSGLHTYLLPFEAIARVKEGSSVEEAVQRCHGGRSSCSDRFGPVPRPERLAAPGESVGRAIIERRYDFFFDRLEEGEKA